MSAVPLDIETLRAILQGESAAAGTRMVAFVTSAVIFCTVFETVRRRKLREELTPLWVTAAVGILILGVSFDVLIWLTNLIGAWTPSSTVFFLGLVFLMAVSLAYAVRLSKLANEVKRLGQEIALLKCDPGGRQHPTGP